MPSVQSDVDPKRASSPPAEAGAIAIVTLGGCGFTAQRETQLPPMRSRHYAPLQLTLAYALLATGWIVLSDLGLAWWHGNSPVAALPSILKGLLFVTVSSAVLYSLATVLTRRALAAETARLDAERVTSEALRRANQFYHTLAQANEAALGAVSRAQLTQDICRILVDEAEIRLAWIGWVDEKTRAVVIEAAVGPAAGYVEGLSVSVDVRRPESRGPSGRSDRKSVV